MSKYKIKSAQATDEVVRIFEENSLNVLATTEMRKVVDKVIVIGIFYFCITCILQKVIWANFFVYGYCYQCYYWIYFLEI